MNPSEDREGTGSPHFIPSVSAEAIARAVKHYKLTKTEGQVLALLAADDSHRQIAQKLKRTVSTVNRHVEHIFEKLGVNSRYQLLLTVLAFEVDVPRRQRDT